MPHLVRVTIIDSAVAEKCEGHCGLDFSAPKTVEEISGLLTKLYGEAVLLEFLDLAESSTSSLYPEIMERVKTKDLALPVLLINGNLRISGYFDIHMLQNVVQVEMESLE